MSEFKFYLGPVSPHESYPSMCRTYFLLRESNFFLARSYHYMPTSHFPNCRIILYNLFIVISVCFEFARCSDDKALTGFYTDNKATFKMYMLYHQHHLNLLHAYLVSSLLLFRLIVRSWSSPFNCSSLYSCNFLQKL